MTVYGSNIVVFTLLEKVKHILYTMDIYFFYVNVRVISFSSGIFYRCSSENDNDLPSLSLRDAHTPCLQFFLEE